MARIQDVTLMSLQLWHGTESCQVCIATPYKPYNVIPAAVGCIEIHCDKLTRDGNRTLESNYN